MSNYPKYPKDPVDNILARIGVHFFTNLGKSKPKPKPIQIVKKEEKLPQTEFEREIRAYIANIDNYFANKQNNINIYGGQNIIIINNKEDDNEKLIT